MYKLSIGCLFRNESNSIVEWIEHYLHHGADHFYLINDDSDDNSCLLLEPYIKNGLVTLINAKWDRILGRQREMYNHYILPLIHESKWLLMLDMDEYMWSPMDINLEHILDANCKHIGQIQVEHTLFGSSGHKHQPDSIVSSFTMRTQDTPTAIPGNRKYFINCEYKFNSLNIHQADFENKEEELTRFILLGNTYFIMNHYSCQSREFWNNVKCTRGDGDFYRERTFSDFDAIDINDVEDKTLLHQNLHILQKL